MTISSHASSPGSLGSYAPFMTYSLSPSRITPEYTRPKPKKTLSPAAPDIPLTAETGTASILLTKTAVEAPSEVLQVATALRDWVSSRASAGSSSAFSVGAGMSRNDLCGADLMGLGRQVATISRTVGDSGSQAFKMQFNAYFRSLLLMSFSGTSTFSDAAMVAKSFPSGGYPCFSASAAWYIFQMGSSTSWTKSGLSLPPAVFFPTIFFDFG